MNTDTKLWKWGLVVLLTAVAILALYPPRDRLKPGIDLAGGTSLIYEIDMSGLHRNEQAGLAERVMAILKARVDPNSQFNLVWRPIGNNRLEIQMPRPPKDARERRLKYEEARDKVRALNVTRAQIESAFAREGDDRAVALGELAGDVEGRRALLDKAAQAWDTYRALRGAGDIEAEIEAQIAYEAAYEEVMATSLPIGRLTDVFALRSSEQEPELKRLKQEFPSHAAAVDAALVVYNAWSEKRGTLEDPADLKRLLRGAGVLEFRILAERDPGNVSMLKNEEASLRQPIAKYADQLQKRGPRSRAGDRYAWYPIEDYVKFMQVKTREEADARRESGTAVVEKYAGKFYVLAHVDDGTETFGLTQASPPWTLKRAFASRDFGTSKPCVDFTLDPKGGHQFARITHKNKGRELAIFLDGVATSHATIRSQISQRGQITGDFSQQRVDEIVRRLEAGSLPARLKESPLQEKNTGPSLGERNRDMGLRAAAYGFIAVAIFMLLYYWGAGVLADIALTLNLLFVLAVMAALEATFTLPGIAGLILTVGMAVDANVLIFERIREERERGVTLRKAVRTGYEKAFSTIVDANLTTLITCVILGYVGSEEVKGFAMTLGFGVVTSMFTALFVTRLIVDLMIDKNVIKSLPMAHLFGRPNILWVNMRRVFWPVSITAVIVGLGSFVYLGAIDKEAIFDIEFLGGTSVQVELADGVDMTAEQVRKLVTSDEDGTASAVQWLHGAAAALRSAQVAAAPSAGEFTVATNDLDPEDVNVLLHTAFEDSLVTGGFTGEGATSRFATKSAEIADKDDPSGVREVAVDLQAFKAGVEACAAYVEKAASRLASARIQTVSDVDAEGEDVERAFEIITVEPSKELVRSAILNTMGDKLKVQRRIHHVLVTDPQRAPTGFFPILEEHDYLSQVIGGNSAKNVGLYKGGVVLVFDQIDPPQTRDAIETRFKEMRLQPQFQQYEGRESEVEGLIEAGVDEAGKTTYSRFATIIADDNLLYSDDALLWEDQLAKPELEQAQEALAAEESLRKVVQFAPQIAGQAQQQALIALVLALGAIVAYVWVRFGTMQFGLAAIVALVHDVSITLGLVTLADYFGIGDFRIDLAMIAALLTVVGYSLNDTIVVFDRIRENRGKLTAITDNIVNTSINMTISRTMLTSVTTLLAVTLLLVFGGPGVRGFSFALFVGVFVGTYSSIAIAAPLLRSRKLLHIVIYAIMGVTLIAVTAVVTGNQAAIVVVSVIVAVLVLLMVNVERRLDQAAASPA